MRFRMGRQTTGRVVSEWSRRPTDGVNEDFDRTVICVLVSQGDDDTGGRTSQRICISSDGMRGALHTCSRSHDQWLHNNRNHVLGR